jgi:hypothetical protein
LCKTKEQDGTKSKKASVQPFSGRHDLQPGRKIIIMITVSSDDMSVKIDSQSQRLSRFRVTDDTLNRRDSGDSGLPVPASWSRRVNSGMATQAHLDPQSYNREGIVEKKERVELKPIEENARSHLPEFTRIRTYLSVGSIG